MGEKLMGEDRERAGVPENMKIHVSSAEIRRIMLDGARMTDRDSLHAYLREQMELPSYYGENLDALHDVLTDIGIETEIRLSHADELWESRFGQLVLRVFRESAQENDCLTLTEIMTEKGEDE
ncbi:MAG: barstar family protein [Lachnospiraceae bacterium]|nr:barstar family protein [Lachnospiraceae bacterium]